MSQELKGNGKKASVMGFLVFPDILSKIKRVK